MPDQPSAPVNAARKFTNQQVGKIAQNLTTQSGDTVAGLTAILNAILAKPSA